MTCDVEARPDVGACDPQGAEAEPGYQPCRSRAVHNQLLSDLDAYAAQFPATEITLPWVHPEGKPVTVKLLMVDYDGLPFRRGGFRLSVWLPALKKAGIEKPTRADGMHALRHLYASVMLDAGESIKPLSSYLGHSDPGFTLRVYTHLLPTSHERTRPEEDPQG
jgi:integrase